MTSVSFFILEALASVLAAGLYFQSTDAKMKREFLIVAIAAAVIFAGHVTIAEVLTHPKIYP